MYPPKKKGAYNLASEHCVVFKLDEAKDYTIYSYQNNSLDCMGIIPKNEVKPNSWNIFPTAKISTIESPVIYFVAGSD